MLKWQICTMFGDKWISEKILVLLKWKIFKTASYERRLYVPNWALHEGQVCCTSRTNGQQASGQKRRQVIIAHTPQELFVSVMTWFLQFGQVRRIGFSPKFGMMTTVPGWAYMTGVVWTYLGPEPGGGGGYSYLGGGPWRDASGPGDAAGGPADVGLGELEFSADMKKESFNFKLKKLDQSIWLFETSCM